MELRCAVQNYAWGIKGLKSTVAQLSKSAFPDLVIDDSLPYAELWMGTHCNGPSTLKGNGEKLSSYIGQNAHVLGPNITKKFGEQLPFLFKVLSVNQALSIQAHPNKSHAEELHASRPNVYKDPNHKPEMAIALTPFQALCGFRPSHELIRHLNEIDELRELIGYELSAAFISHPSEESLKSCFSALMNAPKEKIANSLNRFSERITTMEEKNAKSLLKDVFLTLKNQYPGDGGCFAIYLLNYMVLQPGEAMFLGPNIIHAYLLGDCMECMACSDNVVRAGLTPKYQDVDTLVSMLEYSMTPADSRKFEGQVLDGNTTLFKPPVPDFAVQMIKSNADKTELSLSQEKSASILIIIKGRGTQLSVSPAGAIACPSAIQGGSILFLKSQQAMKFIASADFLAFRALCL